MSSAALLPPPRHARWPIQVFRIASMVAPPAIAWHVASAAPRADRLTAAVAFLLGPLWVAMAVALAGRCLDALRRPSGEVSLLEVLDVLTASGSSLMWTAAAALVAAVRIGWASLSVVGLMGLCFAELVVVWTLLAAGGTDPWRRASLSRRLVPATVVEGDPVVEEIHILGARIPTGFRLFASGRIGPRWATSRYVVGEAAAGGEVLLSSDVGPAIRGEHHAEPLEIWLQDVFGLCHSVRCRAGEAGLTVLPRVRPVDGTEEVIGGGGYAKEPRPLQLPTEGSLRLREYQPGDDARRIHWVRSLTARQVVVRLPDELPPDRPTVRVVLDTFLHGAGQLAGDAPSELLDALVQVWLGTAQALAERGARVTLVAAGTRSRATGLHPGVRSTMGATPAPHTPPAPPPSPRSTMGATPAPHTPPAPPPSPRSDEAGYPSRARVEQRLLPHTLSAALRLGAEVEWQEAIPVDDLLTDGRQVVVSFRLQPDPVHQGAPRDVRWIVVPVSTWATSDEPLQRAAPAVFAHPLGSADNRWSRRRKDRLRRERARHDRDLLLDLCAPARSRADLGESFSAHPSSGERIRLEAL
jgi:uncharacterized protein (DUF58 family)